MKYTKFNNDGWSNGLYTGIIYGAVKLAEQNVFIVPDNIPVNLAFWNGTEVIEKTQAERDAYDAEQVAIAKLARNVFAQLDIREAFKSLGEIHDSGLNEQTLDNLLDGNAEFKKYWLEARSGIDLDHPVTQAALVALNPDETERATLIEAIKLAI